MKIQLTHAESMLLELLRTSVSRKPIHTFLFENADESDWLNCYELAKKQGVLALAWGGLLTLPKELLPPKKVKLPWALYVEKYEKKYAYYVHTLAELREFYAQHGIALVLLKGVGLSAYYSVPEHREGGDLDIYTYSMDCSVMSDEEANALADHLMVEQGIEVDLSTPKHSEFCYKGVPIENHKCFLNEYIDPYTKVLDGHLKEVCQPREVYLLGDESVAVPIPSPEFNTLFVAYHAMQHWSRGLCLHHLCDWACLVNKYGLNIPKYVKEKFFIDDLKAFTAFANCYLGSDIDVYCPEKVFEILLREVFRYPFEEDFKHMSKLGILWFKARRFCHRYKVRRRVVNESLWRIVCESIVNHFRKPEQFFT